MRGAIAAGHPVTAEVGAGVLRAGGTAVDACVAAAFASWVAEPALTGPGGGGFLVAYDAARGRPLALDCFVAVPGAGHAGPVAELEPYIVDFGTGQQVFLVGPGSCAVPGVTAGLEQAHRRLGRLPWAELTRPAVALASEGVELTPAHADVIALLEGFLGSSPEGARIFGPAGNPKGAGELTANPPLAGTLERIGLHGARELADGETAHAIAAHQRATGGQLTLADLAAYRAIRRRPLLLPYRDRTFVTNPPPSSGGALIAHALAVLDAGPPLRGVLAPASVARVAAALRSANAQRTPAFERALYRGGGVRRVLDAARDGQVAHADSAIWPPASPWTTQISVLDGDGNAASLTCSTGCGSGVVVPGTGVHLNNMLGETDLAVSSLRLAPGMRLTSMMAPSLVLRDGQVELVVGSSGSARIRSAIVQVVVAALDLGLPVDEAVELARVHPEGDVLDCEGGVPAATLAALEAAGEQVVRWPGRNIYFGGVQVAARTSAGFAAAGDPRRGGAGIVVAP
ncbi:MAG: gamma-glutamyltranspeptidase / glutathione hydrolase [Gaiellales bacterium]|nr:gamma-glutamyltranspeptidase / glutathione hydrolase [Gaiellales bacterium]